VIWVIVALAEVVRIFKTTKELSELHFYYRGDFFFFGFSFYSLDYCKMSKNGG